MIIRALHVFHNRCILFNGKYNDLLFYIWFELRIHTSEDACILHLAERPLGGHMLQH